MGVITESERLSFHSKCNQGHQSVLRWQISDNVPFQSSFEGCIEKYYRTEERGPAGSVESALVSTASG